MGVFYNSICIPGEEHRRVRDSLLRWLCGRGYVLSEKPVLFDLDGETERCAFLVWNERWTILVFSKYEEERRLIRELQTWADPLLYLWVQDSEVWGYDLFDRGGFTASFSSDPRTFRSFADDDLAGERPAAVPEEVCRRLGLAGSAAELLRIHRLRTVFMEDACAELCRLLGVEPALSTYDELERGAFETLDGWRLEQLLFEVPASDEPRIPDLHELDLGAREAGTGSARVEIPPEVLAEIERRRSRRWTILMLRPLSWLARAVRGAYEAPARRRARARARSPAPTMETPRHDATDVVEVRHLVNERHRCQIRLAAGARARSGSSKPASVFAFEIGGTAVTCTARRRSRIGEVLQRPSRSKILRDEKYTIGGLRARHVVFELPPYYLAGTSGPSYLGLHVVQTGAALYVFLYRFPQRILKDVQRAIRATVSSFRLLDP